ncbi:putative transposase [Acinetobacter baumannii 1505311]|nr:putative transposase [Acinetobacter baumannii 1505311]
MGSCAAPSAKGDDKFITTDYLQQCPDNEDVKTYRTLIVLDRVKVNFELNI